MKEPAELSHFFLEHNPWQSKTNPIWSTTLFQCKRNIARSNFPARLSSDEMHRLFQLLDQSITKFFNKERCTILPAEKLSPIDREFFYEHFLCREGFQNVGLGQGMAIDLQGRFFALLNMQDHLFLQWVDVADSWDSTWNELAKCEESIGKEVAFAFSPEFGFLTANPRDCGTALTVSAYLHVPALRYLSGLDAVLKMLEDVEISGLDGSKSDFIADYLVLKNAYTLGVSEQEILRSVHLSATKIVGEEKRVREQIQKEGNAEIKDRISRAYGLLIHSYQLSTKEALSSLSFIKLGIDLGWAGGVTDQAINHLFLLVRRAHLLKSLGQSNENSPEVQHHRAAFLHQRLKGLQLKGDLV
jgi:protein arginine kinase